MNITHVKPETDDFQAALGISKERGESLAEIMNDAMQTPTLVDTMIHVAEKAENDNEIAFCIFQLGANVGVNRYKEEMLGRALQRMLGGRKGD